MKFEPKVVESYEDFLREFEEKFRPLLDVHDLRLGELVLLYKLTVVENLLEDRLTDIQSSLVVDDDEPWRDN